LAPLATIELHRKIEALKPLKRLEHASVLEGLFDTIRQLMAAPEPKKRKIGFLMEEKAAA